MISDAILKVELKASVRAERKEQVRFLSMLSEFDERKLFLGEGFGSLFQYCVEELGLSEASTSKRIQVARASRKYPLILALVGENSLTLTNAGLLAPHLTEENAEGLLRSACGKKKHEVEKLIVSQKPLPEVKDSIRELPVTFAGERKPEPVLPALPIPSRRDAIKPISATRNRIAFCADDELLEMYRVLQGRFRHKYPQGTFENIAKEAFRKLLHDTDPAKEPARKITPRPPDKHTRYIPAHVRRIVWKRDGGTCTFVGPSGRSCGSRHFLEIDHIIPWSLGGSSHDPDNLTLRCRAHNQLKGGAIPSENEPTGARAEMG